MTDVQQRNLNKEGVQSLIFLKVNLQQKMSVIK